MVISRIVCLLEQNVALHRLVVAGLVGPKTSSSGSGPEKAVRPPERPVVALSRRAADPAEFGGPAKAQPVLLLLLPSFHRARARPPASESQRTIPPRPDKMKLAGPGTSTPGAPPPPPPVPPVKKRFDGSLTPAVSMNG